MQRTGTALAVQLAARREVGQPQITPCDGFIWLHCDAVSQAF